MVQLLPKVEKIQIIFGGINSLKFIQRSVNLVEKPLIGSYLFFSCDMDENHNHLWGILTQV
jgi:hypothetical protein